ncbi:hypothetical protein JTB14_031736 [Gonioctena quinquepunctata]|nr:hypothetical protein JTB14_031736 [Gonioctena quinquepunctata]
MLEYICLVSLLVSNCLAGPQEQQVKSSHLSGNRIHATHHLDGNSTTHTFDDVVNSNGAELGSIAHNSAIQAGHAVQSQHAAGNQIALGIKSSLASAAIGAAQAAQAALVGKQAIVGNLKRQFTDAQKQLQGELTHYQQTEIAAQAARATAHHAQTQVTTLSAAFAAAQAAAHHASQTASEAAASSAAQQTMVAEAKQRVDRLQSRLGKAVEELQETAVSANKALEAAQQARSNVAAASAVVASGVNHQAGRHF